MMLDDTHPEARAVQIELLRRMSIAERIAMADELSRMTTFLSRQAIREVMPGATEQQVILRWIELVYGKELAARVAPLAHQLGKPPGSVARGAWRRGRADFRSARSRTA